MTETKTYEVSFTMQVEHDLEAKTSKFIARKKYDDGFEIIRMMPFNFLITNQKDEDMLMLDIAQILTKTIYLPNDEQRNKMREYAEMELIYMERGGASETEIEAARERFAEEERRLYGDGE